MVTSKRNQINLKKHNTDKTFILNTSQRKEREERRSPKTGTKRVRLWQFHPAPLFPRSPRKRTLPTQGRFGWQDQRQRAQGKGACSVFFALVLPFLFEQNDVWASTTFSGHSAQKAWKDVELLAS